MSIPRSMVTATATVTAQSLLPSKTAHSWGKLRYCSRPYTVCKLLCVLCLVLAVCFWLAAAILLMTMVMLVACFVLSLFMIMLLGALWTTWQHGGEFSELRDHIMWPYKWAGWWSWFSPRMTDRVLGSAKSLSTWETDAPFPALVCHCWCSPNVTEIRPKMVYVTNWCGTCCAGLSLRPWKRWFQSCLALTKRDELMRHLLRWFVTAFVISPSLTARLRCVRRFVLTVLTVRWFF